MHACQKHFSVVLQFVSEKKLYQSSLITRGNQRRAGSWKHMKARSQTWTDTNCAPGWHSQIQRKKRERSCQNTFGKAMHQNTQRVEIAFARNHFLPVPRPQCALIQLDSFNQFHTQREIDPRANDWVFSTVCLVSPSFGGLNFWPGPQVSLRDRRKRKHHTFSFVNNQTLCGNKIFQRLSLQIVQISDK